MYKILGILAHVMLFIGVFILSFNFHNVILSHNINEESAKETQETTRVIREEILTEEILTEEIIVEETIKVEETETEPEAQISPEYLAELGYNSKKNDW